jgi:hypothetical protein
VGRFETFPPSRDRDFFVGSTLRAMIASASDAHRHRRVRRGGGALLALACHAWRGAEATVLTAVAPLHKSASVYIRKLLLHATDCIVDDNVRLAWPALIAAESAAADRTTMCLAWPWAMGLSDGPRRRRQRFG